MKEIWMVIGFGAGVVTGALLFKHSQEAKQLVNKGEKAVKKEMENLKEIVTPQQKKSEKQSKKKAAE